MNEEHDDDYASSPNDYPLIAMRNVPIKSPSLIALEQNRKLFSDDWMISSAETSLHKFQALIDNIGACVALGERMKSLLGPRSRDKLLIDADNEISLTNDGATALKCLNTPIPAQKILTQLSIGMDAESGDGTTSVVVFASALLRHAMHLIKNQDLHPQMIINGYGLALNMLVSYMTSNCNLVKEFKPFEKENEHLLLQVAKTCLNSKIAAYSAPKLAQLAVRAILRSFGNEKKAHIICGGVSSDNPMTSGFRGGTIMNESYILPGNSIMIQSKLYSDRKIDLANVKVAVLAFDLDVPKDNLSHKYKIDVSSLSQLDRLIREEESFIKKMAVNLKKLGVQFLCIQQSLSGVEAAVSDTAKHWLSRSKIELLKPLPQEDIETICDVLNIQPIISNEQLAALVEDKDNKQSLQPFIRRVNRIYNHSIGDQSYTIFTMPDDPQSVQHTTLVLRAPSQVAIEELDRAFHDIFRVLSTLIKEPKLLPGGGACEINVRTYLQLVLDGEIDCELAKEISSMERIVIQSYMEALDEILLALCSNAGINSVSTLNQLRQIHREVLLSNKVTYSGIYIPQQRDISSKCRIANMFEQGIMEPASNKIAQWQMATQAAIQILKIDGTFVQRERAPSHVANATRNKQGNGSGTTGGEATKTTTETSS